MTDEIIIDDIDVDVDALTGEVDACMQSPECTDSAV
jgi:hypothetical protein